MMRGYIVGSHYGVNHKFVALARRPDAAAAVASSRTGRAFGGRAPANSGHGPIADFQSSGAIETCRRSLRSPRREKCLLWRKPSGPEFTARARGGNNPDARARIAGNVARSHESQARPAQTAGQSAEILQRTGRQVWAKLCAGPLVEGAGTYAHYSSASTDGGRPRSRRGDTLAVAGEEGAQSDRHRQFAKNGRVRRSACEETWI